MVFGTVYTNYLAGWDGCRCLHVKSNGRWKVLAVLKNKQTKKYNGGSSAAPSQVPTETIRNTKTNLENKNLTMVLSLFVTYQLEEPWKPLPNSTGTMTKKYIVNSTVDQ